MSDPKRARAEDGRALPRPVQRFSRPIQAPKVTVVYVLVKTSDSEDGPVDDEVAAETEVIGTYRTRAVAKKARRIAVRNGDYEPVGGQGDPFDIHDDDGDDVTYHDSMSDLNTNFKIFKQTVLDDVSDDDGGSEDDEEDVEDEGEEGEEEEGGQDEEGEDDEEGEEDDDDEEEDDL
mmetsp:Transcript_38606/g.64969  ORF Transcript_38606/g.64969 Transcript_38606/m.64969 type:complete len:176 (-) Transcript_38606:518-1045(-)